MEGGIEMKTKTTVLKDRIYYMAQLISDHQLHGEPRKEIDDYLIQAEHHIAAVASLLGETRPGAKAAMVSEYWLAKDNVELAEAKLRTLGIKIRGDNKEDAR
jgi:hypothetical protein